MLSFERELLDLGADERALAIERREIFSVYPELRAVSWIGAVLVATGVGVVVARNLDRIGPVVLAMGIAAAAAACYGYAAWRRRPAPLSLVDESILFLGSLLLSADLAYVEVQFHLLDRGWPRHFLLMAIVHGVVAYLFDSRTVLSLSLAALMAWFGVEQRVETFFQSTAETSVRAFSCAAVILLWRFADARWRAGRSFERLFEHFAANLALFGALLLTFDDTTRPLGTLLSLVLTVAVIAHGFRVREEAFVLYGYVYGVIAIDIFVADLLNREVLVMFFLLLSSIAAIAGLFLLHAAFRRRAA